MNYLEIYKNSLPIGGIMVGEEFKWADISEKLSQIPEINSKSPYDFCYETNLIDFLNDQTLNKIKEKFNDFDEVYQMTRDEYRQYDEQFDNECKLLDYVMSKKFSLDKKTLISKELLEKNGFEDITNEFEKEYYQKTFGIEDYKSYRIWTDKVDKNPGKVLKLDFDNALSNSGRLWNLHIDNCDCCTVGSAELDNVWQFNTLMEVFGSKFRIDSL